MMLPRIALNWLGASKSRHACGLQDPLLGPSAHVALRSVAAACTSLLVIRVVGNPLAQKAGYRHQLTNLFPTLTIIDDRERFNCLPSTNKN